MACGDDPNSPACQRLVDQAADALAAAERAAQETQARAASAGVPWKLVGAGLVVAALVPYLTRKR